MPTTSSIAIRPTTCSRLYDLVILEEPAYDASKWTIIQPTDDPEWLEKSSAPVAWDLAYLHVHYAASLEDSHPEAADLLSKIKLTTDQVSHMTFGLVVEKMSAADYAHAMGCRITPTSSIPG